MASMAAAVAKTRGCHVSSRQNWTPTCFVALHRGIGKKPLSTQRPQKGSTGVIGTSDPPASGPRPLASLGLHAAVLGLYCAVAAVLGRSLWGGLSSRLYGSVTEDGAVNYWNTWHLGHALASGQSPFLTEQIFHPMGANLAFHNHTAFNGLLCMLLEPLAGPLAAYNLSVLLTFVLCGHGMFLLARRLTHDDLAAVVAGLLFAFCSFRVLRSMAHLNIASNQFLPYYVLLLLAGMGRWRWSRLLGAGALLAATGYASYYNLGFALVFSGLCAAHLGWRVLRRRGLPVERGLPASLTALAARLAVVGLCAATLLAPLIHAMLQGMTSDTPGVGLHGLTGLQTDWSRYGADLLSFFLPMPYHPLMGGLVSAETYFGGPGRGESAGLFLGAAVILLAGAGLWLCRADRRFRLWMGAGLVFILLSLGGALRLGGHELLVTPLARLLSSVPLLGALWTWSRWSLPGLFCLVVAGAIVLATLRRSLATPASRSRPRLVLAGLVGLAVILDASLVLMHVEAQEVRPASPALSSIRADNSGGAVLDLPVAWEYSGQTPRGNLEAVRRYMFNQTVHQHRIVGGFAARGSAEGWRYLRGLPLLSDLTGLAETGRASPVNEQDRRVARRVLWLLGVKYILVHQTELSAQRLLVMVKWTQQITGARRLPGGGDLIALAVPSWRTPPSELRAGGALGAALLAGWDPVTRPAAGRPHVCASPGGPRPQLLLRTDPSSKTRRIWLRLRSSTGSTVMVRVNGQRGQTLEPGPGWQDHALRLDSEAWRAGINRLVLEGARGLCLEKIRFGASR